MLTYWYCLPLGKRKAYAYIRNLSCYFFALLPKIANGLLLISAMVFIRPSINAQPTLVSLSSMDTTDAQKLLVEVKERLGKGQVEGTGEKLTIAAEIFKQVVGQESASYADVLHQFGRLGLISGDVDKGILFTEKALAIRIKVLGYYHLDVANSYFNLGNAYGKKKDFVKAAEYRKKVWEIRLELQGQNHPDVVTAYKNMGLAYGAHYYYKAVEAYAAHDLENAIQQLQRSDSVFLAQKDYLWVLQLRIMMAEYYYRAGKAQMTIQTCQSAIPIVQLAGQTDSLAEAMLLNSYASGLLQMDRINQSEYTYLRAINIKKKILGENTPEIGMEISNLATLYFKKGKFKTAIQLAKQGIALREGGLSPNPNLLLAYMSTGFIHDQAGFQREAFAYYHKAEQIINSDPVQYKNQVGILYQSIASSYHNSGDFDKSIAYNELAKLSYSGNFGSDNVQIANIHFNLGLVAIGKEDWPLVVDHARQALRILQLDKKNTRPNNLIDCYEQLSNGFLKINVDSSLYYAKLALQLSESLPSDDDHLFANSHLHLGLVYAELNRFKEADSLMLLSEPRVLKVFGDKHVMTGLFLHNRADIQAKAGDYDSALALYDATLQAYGYTKGGCWDTLINANPVLSALQKRNRVLIRCYRQEKNSALIADIEAGFSEILDLLNYLRRNYQGQETKLIFAAQFKEAAEDAIDWHQRIGTPHALEQAWSFAEKSRSLALLEAMHNAKAWQFNGIADSVRLNEESFVAAANKWRKEYERAEKKPERDSCYSLWLNTKIEHEDWLKQLESRDSNFFKLKYNNLIIDTKGTQALLKNQQQSLLEYFIGDSSIYIFLIQAEHYEIVKVKKDPAFEQWVNDLTRDGIYGNYALPINKQSPLLKDKTLKNYGVAASKLYETLIAPVKSKLSEKVIIIPDDILGYVPFEALLTEKPPRPDAIATYKYLIKEHQISYCYSATLLYCPPPSFVHRLCKISLCFKGVASILMHKTWRRAVYMRCATKYTANIRSKGF